MRKIVIFTILICSLIFCINVSAQDDIKVYIFGNKILFDVPPVAENGRTLVPARAVFEDGLGASVTWHSKNKQVTIIKDDTVIKLTLDKKEALVNGEEAVMDVPAKAINGRTLIPLRFISEIFNYDVAWDGEENSVLITKKPGSEETAEEEEKGAIRDIVVEETANDNLLNIELSEYEEPEIFTLKDPFRIVLDFKETKFHDVGGKINIDSGFITQVRWADHDGYYRIVIECPGKQPYKFVQTGHDKFSIIVGTPDTKVDTASEEPPDESVNEEETTGTNNSGLENEENEDTTEETQYENPEDDPLYRDGPMEKPCGTGPLVVIDAGHGGKDPGALGKDELGEVIYKDGKIAVREKDINLAVALQTYRFLKNEGVNVMMTRSNDEFIELRDIATIANNADATLFVSIHSNSVENVPNANGTEVLYYNTEEKDTYGIESKKLAENIQAYMVDVCDMLDRGLKERPGLAVLKWTEMPAALVELGFVTNTKDTEKLIDPKWQEDAGWSVAQGIIRTLEQMDE